MSVKRDRQWRGQGDYEKLSIFERILLRKLYGPVINELINWISELEITKGEKLPTGNLFTINQILNVFWKLSIYGRVVYNEMKEV